MHSSAAAPKPTYVVPGSTSTGTTATTRQPVPFKTPSPTLKRTATISKKGRRRKRAHLRDLTQTSPTLRLKTNSGPLRPTDLPETLSSTTTNSSTSPARNSAPTKFPTTYRNIPTLPSQQLFKPGLTNDYRFRLSYGLSRDRAFSR